MLASMLAAHFVATVGVLKHETFGIYTGSTLIFTGLKLNVV